jgi:hypothetical protein
LLRRSPQPWQQAVLIVGAAASAGMLLGEDPPWFLAAVAGAACCVSAVLAWLQRRARTATVQRRLRARRVMLQRLRNRRASEGADRSQTARLGAAVACVEQAVVVLDPLLRVAHTSRGALRRFPGLEPGQPLPGCQAQEAPSGNAQPAMDKARSALSTALATAGNADTALLSPLTGTDGAPLGYLVEWSVAHERHLVSELERERDALREQSREAREAIARAGAANTEWVAAAQLTADVLLSGAHGLSLRMATLSQRAREQAAAFEATAASIEQLTGTIRQTADNASQANQLAGAMRELAVRGGEVVTRAVDGMQAIDRSSRKIAEIVGAIDEIAFQTSLLALNAAVEAARAGEQGKGFAVVASEVRTLAQRSAEAAQQIKELIRDTVAKVHNGTQLVDESGRALGAIVISVKRVTDLIAEISAASREQAGSVEGIDRVLLQTGQVSSENASLADEALQAVNLLAEQTAALVDAVRQLDAGRPVDLQRRWAAPTASRARERSQGSSKERRRPVAAAPAASAGRSETSQEWDSF